MYLFSVFKYRACQSSYFQPNKLFYIFLRSAINVLSIKLLKSAHFQSLKIGLECLLKDEFFDLVEVPTRS